MNRFDQEIRQLYLQRPRSRFVRWSVLLMLLLVAGAWTLGDFSLEGLLSPRRLENLQRFIGELRPYPLQGKPFDWGVVLDWSGRMLAGKGAQGALTTLAISVAAIVLAGAAGSLLAMPAARNLASAEPFLPWLKRTGRLAHLLWGALVQLTRFVLLFARAIPEYLWAFLLLAMLGPSAWPAVLALALHNMGILGKLSAEVFENLEQAPLAAQRALGASRLQIAMAGIFPLAFSRLLLFFFYRWESCVREATVLGMLGIVSLGFWIQDARARNLYDEMLFLILIGSALVLVGDLLSALAREMVRRAS
ncbi:MAG: ABC transporter permease subunit [Acidobacteriota bacterium]